MPLEDIDSYNSFIAKEFDFLHDYGFYGPLELSREPNNMCCALLYKFGNNYGMEIYYELYSFYIYLKIARLSNGRYPPYISTTPKGSMKFGIIWPTLAVHEFLGKYCPDSRSDIGVWGEKINTTYENNSNSDVIAQNAQFLKKYMPAIMEFKDRFIADIDAEFSKYPEYVEFLKSP